MKYNCLHYGKILTWSKENIIILQIINGIVLTNMNVRNAVYQ